MMLASPPGEAAHRKRRVGREAEGGGLLNRYRTKSSIGGSNPPLSARTFFIPFKINTKQLLTQAFRRA
jgi:hypothetical protein